MGKSCILLQFTDKRFKAQHDITIGVEFGTKMIVAEKKDIKLQIWDTVSASPGRTRVVQVHYQDILHERRGRTTCFRHYKATLIIRRDTFKNVTKWLEDLKENSSNEIVIILVGNKCDMEPKSLFT